MAMTGAHLVQQQQNQNRLPLTGQHLGSAQQIKPLLRQTLIHWGHSRVCVNT